MNSLFRILSFMKRRIIIYFMFLIIIGILFAIYQIQLASLFQFMFDELTLGRFKTIFDGIYMYIIYIIIILLILPVCNYIVGRINVLTSANMRKAISDKLIKLPITYFKEHHSGDVISRCTNDVAETERAYKVYLINFVSNLFMGIITITYTFYIEWRLGLISVASGMLILFVNVFYAKILRNISVEVQEKLARLNERFSNILAGIQVIRVFNIYHVIMKKYCDSNDSVYDKSKQRVEKQAIMATLNNMIFFVGFLGLAMVGAYLAIIGEISFGVIVAVVQLQNGVNNLVYGLGNFITQIQTSLAASDRVFELLDEEEEPETYHLENSNDRKTDDVVSFEKIIFGYDEDLVLNQLSFSLPKNKVYALVGPSGGGKTTILKLILNFYPPHEGDIHLNGQSISDQKIKEIRKMISYVPQDAYLFSGTIAENISYGNINASMDEIIEAAKLANAHDFIMQLEKGYESETLENGAGLSGGERQRIAIARAILKNAPILLLDEATSALDSESEKLVQDALNKLMVNKTTLIIAHRLSTVQHADKILVVSDGILVEQGSHDDLLKNQEGLYTKLYNQQFA